MDKRNPFTILDIAPGTESSVIEAAYLMLASQVTGIGSTEKELGALAEIEWAYKELKDPELRLEHYRRHSRNTDGEELQTDSGEGDKPNETKGRWQTAASVLVSAALFCGMLGAIGYGLYLVGAVRPEVADGKLTGSGSDIVVAGTVTNGPSELGNQTMYIGHTATVESLRATATRMAVGEQKAGLTATVEMAQLALTPEPVLLRACPNVASVNVRTGAGTGYKAIGYILEGDCVNAIGRNGDGDWLVIQNAPRPSSDGGWVSATLMTIEGEADALPEIEAD